MNYLVDKPSSKLTSWEGTGRAEERLEVGEMMMWFFSDQDEEEGRLQAVGIFCHGCTGENGSLSESASSWWFLIAMLLVGSTDTAGELERELLNGESEQLAG